MRANHRSGFDSPCLHLIGDVLYAFDASAYVTENGTYSLGFANSNLTYEP